MYDNWNLIHETVTSVDANSTTNVTEIEYFWGPDLSNTLQGAGGVGGLLAVSQNGQFYFPVYDNNGNVVKYLDESGSIVSSYTYDDFGRTLSAAGPLASSFAFLFSTKYFDVETKFYCYGYRFYSPLFCFWVNRDPIAEGGGVNVYAFCWNTYGLDLLGLMDCSCKVCLYSAIDRVSAKSSGPLLYDRAMSGHTWFNLESCDTPEDGWVEVDPKSQFSFGPDGAIHANVELIKGVPSGRWKVDTYRNLKKYRVVKKCWALDAKQCCEIRRDMAADFPKEFSAAQYCTNTTLDFLKRHGVNVPEGVGPIALVVDLPKVGNLRIPAGFHPNPRDLARELEDDYQGRELPPTDSQNRRERRK